MGRGHSSPAAKVSLRTGTTGRERNGPVTLFSRFHKAMHQSEGCTSSALSFYGNLPPGLHYSMLKLILTTQHNK